MARRAARLLGWTLWLTVGFGCSTSAPSSPTCTEACAGAAACDGGSGFGADCQTTCPQLGGVIDRQYWSGVAGCSAQCTDRGSCLAGVAAQVPPSTVDGFLRDLCSATSACAGGVSVEQCVASLQSIGGGADGGTSPWAAFGLFSAATRSCISQCVGKAGCGNFGAASLSCAGQCGVPLGALGGSGGGGDPGEPCPTYIDCGPHGTCRMTSNISACVCDSGWASQGLRCLPDCRPTGACGGGTCGTDGLCTCNTGYVTAPDGTCKKDAKFTRVATGGGAACALRDDGRIECFGNSSSRATTPAADTDFVDVCVDQGFTAGFGCGLKSNGAVSCWGLGFPSGMPAQVALACGAGFACVVDAQGKIVCSGFGAPGSPPTAAFVQLSAMEQEACGRDATGAVQCWGTRVPSLNTPPSNLASGARLVALGRSSACGITSAGALSCWGNNLSIPADAGTVMDVALGDSFACVRHLDRSIRCWLTGGAAGLPPTGVENVTNVAESMAAAGDGTSFCFVVNGGWEVACYATTSSLAGEHRPTLY